MTLEQGGPVVVPDSLAAEVLATLTLGLALRVRRDGAGIGPTTRELLAALIQAADRSARGCANANEITASRAPRETMTTAEAAQQLGCSQANVRALAAAGRLRARRTRRVWLLDPASVATYQRRSK